MLTRERPRTPVRALMPSPAPLPSLSDALARRAAIFGPVYLDPAPVAPRGALERIAVALRRAADLLEPRAGRSSFQRYHTTATAGPASRAKPTVATTHCSQIGSLALTSSRTVARCSAIVSSPRLPAPLQ